MAFVQRIRDSCADHDGCRVIDCITTEPVPGTAGDVIHEAGAVVWHSHMHSAIHPEHRLNPDHPAEDHRDGEPVPVTMTPWCEDCKTHPACPA